MIHDAKVAVSCDDCGDFMFVEPEFVYMDTGGGGGHYDTRDESLNRKIEKQGWLVCGDNEHFCEECRA